MRYLGGKHRQGKKIAEYTGKVLRGDQTYIEPFCGAMGSAWQVAKTHKGKIVLSDSHVALISMWRAVLFDGWIPPETVSEEEYNRVKQIQNPDDPLTAFVGFGCSFAAQYFKSYAKEDFARRGQPGYSIPPALASSRLIIKRKASIVRESPGLVVECCGYTKYRDTTGAVFYLDPPYAGRSKQSQFAFGSEEFWDFARELTKSNVVLATEFVVPSDFVVLHNFGDTVVRHYSGKGSDGTQEMLVCHESQLHLFGD